MRTTTLAVVILLGAIPARAAPDRLALLQLDAFFADARNRAVVVREAAEQVAAAANLDADPIWSAFDAAVSGLVRQAAAVQQRRPPARFVDVALAVADVERDRRALRATMTAHDVNGAREDAAHVLQALARVDRQLDAVFNVAGFERLHFLRATECASR